MKRTFLLMIFTGIYSFSYAAADYTVTLIYKNNMPFVKTYYKSTTRPVPDETCQLLTMANQGYKSNHNPKKIHSCSDIVADIYDYIYDVYNSKYQIISQKVSFSDGTDLELRDNPSKWFDVPPNDYGKSFRLSVFVAFHEKFMSSLSPAQKQCFITVELSPIERYTIPRKASKDKEILFTSLNGREVYKAALDLAQLDQNILTKHCK